MKIKKGIPLIDQHDKNGFWGKFGGNFIPETLKKPVEDLAVLFAKLRKDKELEKFSKLNIDYFQIYGNHNSESISNIKSKFNKKIIVAIQVKNEKDILNYKEFENIADIILWDSSGLERSLEWNYNWIKSVPKNITKMIAGNINIDKLEKISKLADIVDVSGALETNQVKDILKIKNFLKNIKKLNNEN